MLIWHISLPPLVWVQTLGTWSFDSVAVVPELCGFWIHLVGAGSRDWLQPWVFSGADDCLGPLPNIFMASWAVNCLVHTWTTGICQPVCQQGLDSLLPVCSGPRMFPTTDDQENKGLRLIDQEILYSFQQCLCRTRGTRIPAGWQAQDRSQE